VQRSEQGGGLERIGLESKYGFSLQNKKYKNVIDE